MNANWIRQRTSMLYWKAFMLDEEINDGKILYRCDSWRVSVLNLVVNHIL